MMRKFTLFFLCLFLFIVNGTAQVSCNQEFGSTGYIKIPISQTSIGAIDLNVSPNTTFNVEKVELTIFSNTPMVKLKAMFYSDNMQNQLASQSLNMEEIASINQGQWKITFTLADKVALKGGASGSKYWVAIASEDSAISWAASDYVADGKNSPMKFSLDNGKTWSNSTPTITTPLEGSIKVVGQCVNTPTTDCTQSVTSNSFESGGSVNGNWVKAIDLVTQPNQDFLLKQIQLNVLTSAGTNIVKANIKYYEDNKGLPGNLIGQQLNIIPTKDVYLDTINEFNDKRIVTLDVNPTLFKGKIGLNTHYWISINLENNEQTNVWLESTSMNTLGYKMASYHNEQWNILWSSEGVYSLSGDCLPFDLETACNTKFYDSGNISSNYQNNENKTWNIIPEKGKMASVEFTSFATEQGYDGLMIYDGPDTSFPIISSIK